MSDPRDLVILSLQKQVDRLRQIAKYYLNHGSTPELQQMCRAALAALDSTEEK